MAVPQVFDTLEQTSVSLWLRESESIFGFYFILLFHTFGLSLLVGANAIMDLRLLGAAPDLPVRSLTWLFRIMWIGFAINATTGVLLLIAYPTKTLTNPMFYVKLTLIALALLIATRIKTRLFDDSSMDEAVMVAKVRPLAKWSLALWIGAITAGRLLAYTASWLVYGVRGG